MADWKEMYLTLMRDTERAIRILTEAQQTCEELYLQEEGPPLSLIPKTAEIADAGGAEALPVSAESAIFQEKTVDKPGRS